MLQGQVQYLTAENSALRHQVTQLRAQVKSYETKLRSLTLSGDGAMRSAMLEKHEQLRKVHSALLVCEGPTKLHVARFWVKHFPLLMQ